MPVDHGFQTFLQLEADKHNISKAERAALNLVVDGYDVTAVAQKLDVRPEAIRQRLSQIYHKFNVEGRGPVKLGRLLQSLRSGYQAYQDQIQNRPSEVIEYTDTSHEPRIDFKEAPEISNFQGRQEELEALKKAINSDNQKLVLLWGAKGSGKSALALTLAKQLKGKFDCLVYRSIARVKSTSELIHSLMQFFDYTTEMPEEIEAKIKLLLNQLQKQRCLVILDDLDLAFTKESTEYIELLEQVVTTNHSSCLVGVGQNQISTISLPSFKREIKGLTPEDVRQVFLAVKGTVRKEWLEHLQLFDNNPTALQIMLNIIPDGSGDWIRFTRQNSLLIKEVVKDLLQNTQRSSDVVKLKADILDYLLARGESLTLKDVEDSLTLEKTDHTVIDTADNFTNRPAAVKKAIASMIKDELITSSSDDLEHARFTLAKEFKNKVTSRLIARYLNQIGYKKYMDGDFRSAKADFLAAIQFNEELAAAHYNLGSTYEELDDLDLARRHYDLAASFTGKAADAAINNLARLYIFEGSADKAINMLNDRIEDEEIEDSIRATMYKNLGWAYWLSKDYAKAEEYLEQAVELDPERATPYYLLARIAEEFGNEDEAMEYWQKCIDKETEKSRGKYRELDVWQLEARQRLANPPVTKRTNGKAARRTK